MTTMRLRICPFNRPEASGRDPRLKSCVFCTSLIDSSLTLWQWADLNSLSKPIAIISMVFFLVVLMYSLAGIVIGFRNDAKLYALQNFLLRILTFVLIKCYVPHWRAWYLLFLQCHNAILWHIAEQHCKQRIEVCCLCCCSCRHWRVLCVLCAGRCMFSSLCCLFICLFCFRIFVVCLLLLTQDSPLAFCVLFGS